MDYLKEKANALRNEMNQFWGAIFITGGGAIGFTVLENRTVLTWIYATIGFLLAIIFANAFIQRRIELLNIVTDLKKIGEKHGTLR